MKVYLEVMECLFIIIGASFMVLCGMAVDGPQWEIALKFMQIGLVSMVGGLVCQELNRPRKH